MECSLLLLHPYLSSTPYKQKPTYSEAWPLDHANGTGDVAQKIPKQQTHCYIHLIHLHDSLKEQTAKNTKVPRKSQNIKKHTTVGIRWSSPTQLLIHRSGACVWQSGRDAQFSPVYGRM
jgi:hypothetical protein